MIHTVNGAMPKETFGHMQLHEHIWLNKGASYNCNPALVADDWLKSMAELIEYRKAGGSLIVDAQPTGCGRNAKALSDLMKGSGVGIVAVSGFHLQKFFDQKELLEKDRDELADLYCRELTEGMLECTGEWTSHPTGMLKIAMENSWKSDPVYVELCEAVAAAAARCGAPVMVHTEKENDIQALLTWLDNRGVSPEHVMICHLDRTHHDASYHKDVLASGCWMDYDSVHRLKYVSEREEMDLLLAMKDAGYLNRIVLALDTTSQRLRAYGAQDMGLDYILRTHIPFMKAEGFTDEEIRMMTVDNARTVLNY